jgi:DNA-binding transcriptional ArsR family regulator
MYMQLIPLSDKMVDHVARRFRTLGEPFRLRILQALESGEHTVTQLVDALDANQSNVSKHLQVLFDASLVGRRREGNSILYSIADPVVFKLCELVCRSAARTSQQQYEDLHPAPALLHNKKSATKTKKKTSRKTK